MIASLKGHIASKSPTVMILEVNSVGYEVFIPLSTYYKLPEENESVFLHICTHVREDAFQLFGFATPTEKAAFLMLQRVASVGAKLALNILSGIGLQDLVTAIREENVVRLKAIPGVGPKMAGRLILELREKINDLGLESEETLSPAPGAPTRPRDDALSALVNLGYSQNDVRRVMDRLNKENSEASVEDLIREGLKNLSKVK